MSAASPRMLCFGEILWDFLPDGIFPGGAPFNVAYHLRQLEVETHLISAVGWDLLGDELLRRLRHWGLSTETIERHQGLPTGYVVATLGASGEASYDITSSVAWDQITVTEDGLRAAIHTDALVFGSLALRSPFNRAALERLMAVVPAQAWRVFDVNLRAPYDNLALVRELATRTTLLKLNAGEAARLVDGGEPGFGREERDARYLEEQYGCPMVCITSGPHGAGLLHQGKWHWETGRPVVVADTVGAGDAFLAALLTLLMLQKLPTEDCLAHACRLGEWVASQRGATPVHPSNSASY
ncbi:MAG: carbohydrate kinase [Cephaloticoccus sp.]|nr:carbohydrate kinase [Cephaloticoccus sp.]MCF7761572.1 carbohydrate kinase [Cephaloticoccus sp.]